MGRPKRSTRPNEQDPRGWRPTRRDVLKLAGVSVAGVAATTLLEACTPDGFPSPTRTPGPTTTSPIPGLLATPQPILVPTPTTWSSPTAAASTLDAAAERARISYLLRRAGFGASPGALDRYAAMGRTKTTTTLLDYDQVDN